MKTQLVIGSILIGAGAVLALPEIVQETPNVARVCVGLVALLLGALGVATAEEEHSR